MHTIQYNIQCTVQHYTVQYTMLSTIYSKIYNVQYNIQHAVQYTLYSTIYSIQCNIQCTVQRPTRFNKRSYKILLFQGSYIFFYTSFCNTVLLIIDLKCRHTIKRVIHSYLVFSHLIWSGSRAL